MLKWYPFLYEKFSSKAKSYSVTELFNYALWSLHYFPHLFWKGAAGRRVMTQKLASILCQALHPMQSKSEQCSCHDSDYSKETNSSWALPPLQAWNPQRLELLVFLQLFPGQERGRVRYVGGKAQQETVRGSQEGKISMERDCEKGNKGRKKSVHLQVSGCNVWKLSEVNLYNWN